MLRIEVSITPRLLYRGVLAGNGNYRTAGQEAGLPLRNCRLIPVAFRSGVRRRRSASLLNTSRASYVQHDHLGPVTGSSCIQVAVRDELSTFPRLSHFPGKTLPRNGSRPVARHRARPPRIRNQPIAVSLASSHCQILNHGEHFYVHSPTTTSGKGVVFS